MKLFLDSTGDSSTAQSSRSQHKTPRSRERQHRCKEIGFESAFLQENNLPLHLGKKMVRVMQLAAVMNLKKGCATTTPDSTTIAPWTVAVFVAIVNAILIQ